VTPVDVADLPSVWQKLLDTLAARGPALQSLLINGRLTGIADGQATIRYERRHETFVKLLERNGKKDAVRDALTAVTGGPVGVRFEIDDSDDAAVSNAIDSGGLGVATAVAAPVVARVQPAPPRPAARREPVRVAVEPPQPAAPVVKITPELIESLKSSEPLIATLIDDLGAQIIKVEPPDAPATSNSQPTTNN
jgi:hypothetical protein